MTLIKFSQVHKAYKGISLILHPDHSDGSHLATEKFKVLSKVHDFLMNEDSRRIYDETGAVSVFKVSNEQYEKCRQLYQGSKFHLFDLFEHEHDEMIFVLERFRN